MSPRCAEMRGGSRSACGSTPFGRALTGLVGERRSPARGPRDGRGRADDPRAGARALRGGVGVVLARADDDRPRRRCSRWSPRSRPPASRACSGDRRRSPSTSTAPPSAAIAGAFAAVVVAAARRAHTSCIAPSRRRPRARPRTSRPSSLAAIRGAGRLAHRARRGRRVRGAPRSPPETARSRRLAAGVDRRRARLSR